jgi:hypothetical protein
MTRLCLRFFVLNRKNRTGRSLTGATKRAQRQAGYVQDGLDITKKFSLEAGFHPDVVKDYGILALPGVSN